MNTDNHKTRRSYGRVHGVVARTYAHSLDVVREPDGATVHAIIPDRLAAMAHGLGKGSVVDMHGLLIRDGRRHIMHVERIERFTPRPRTSVTAADLPHVDFTAGLGSVAYVSRLRADE